MKEKIFQWLNGRGTHIFLIVVLAIILAGTFFTFYAYSTLEQQKVRKEIAHEVILDLNKLTSLIMAGDVGTRGYMLIQEDRFIGPLIYAQDGFQDLLNKIDRQLKIQAYPEMDTLDIIKQDIRNYIELLGTMHRFAEAGNLEAAEEILYEDQGNGLISNYFRFQNKVVAFENNVISEANRLISLAISTIAVIQWMLLIIGIPTLSLVMFNIKRGAKSRQELFAELDASNKKYIFNPVQDEADNFNEQSIIQSIINNLKQASGFIKSITKGDYSVRWEGINENNREANKDNIAGELIQMREQMKKVKEADQRRLWATEGLSKVAEITRKYQHDVQLLSDQLVISVVKYLDANQAGLFTVNDDDSANKYLELIACYAYERKKYLKKQVEIGEGLLGQAYLEQDTIYMTELPQEYIAITSGLGKAVPNSILIVPLKYNEEVMGVLEIASFKTFEDYQIKFVEELAEIIASSLSTVKINARTKALLDQSQEQAEQMRSQEEEMRQNMEELQATQEEMERKTKEYEEIIQRYEEEAAQKKTEA